MGREKRKATACPREIFEKLLEFISGQVHTEKNSQKKKLQKIAEQLWKLQ